VGAVDGLERVEDEGAEEEAVRVKLQGAVCTEHHDCRERPPGREGIYGGEEKCKYYDVLTVRPSLDGSWACLDSPPDRYDPTMWSSQAAD
jgi:hypothetical protein